MRDRIGSFSSWTAAFVAILPVAPAAAIEPLPDAGATSIATTTYAELASFEDLSLEDLLDIKLGTGSFLDLDLRRSPFSMTIIDRKQIALSGARHLSELLEIFVPGFHYYVNDDTGVVWGMRGVATDRNTKVLFLVNGLKMNQQARDGAHTETTLGLLDDVERIEVLRGPAGLVYGSGAIAGVVNVVTRTPSGTMAQASATYASGTSFGGSALAHAELPLDIVATVSAGYRQADGYGDQSSSIFGPGPVVDQRAREALPSYPAAGSPWATPGNARLGLDLSYEDLRLYARFTRQRDPLGALFIPDSYGDVYGLGRRVLVADSFSVQTTYEHAVGPDRVTLELAWAASDNATEVTADRASGTPGSVLDAMGERRYYVEGRYLLQRIADLQAAFGIQYRIDDIGEDLQGRNMSYGQPLRPSVANIRYSSLALFGEGYYELGDTFALTGGLRVDKHTRTNFILSPRAAAVVSFSPSHTLKAIVQASSNNATADTYEYNRNHYSNSGELLGTLDVVSGIPLVSEHDLHSIKPERAISFELASTHSLSAELSWAPSVSYTRVSDLQSWNDTLYRQVNVGSYSFVAAEAEARLQLEHLQLVASHTFQRLVDTGNDSRTLTVDHVERVQQPDGSYELVTTGEDTYTVSASWDWISRDGVHFAALPENSTKVFVSYSPFDWLDLSTSVRLVWGLVGLRSYYKDLREDGAVFDDRDAPNGLICKWNVGVRFTLPYGLSLSLQGYDLLGTDKSLASLRWSNQDLYSIDQRAFAATLEGQL